MTTASFHKSGKIPEAMLESTSLVTSLPIEVLASVTTGQLMFWILPFPSCATSDLSSSRWSVCQVVLFSRDCLARNADSSFVNLLATPESGPPSPFNFQYVVFYCCLLIIIDVSVSITNPVWVGDSFIRVGDYILLLIMEFKDGEG